MENNLANHILAMADDAYLTGHPEWQSLVAEAQSIIDQEEETILIGWCVEDVIQRAEEEEKEITREEAIQALRFVNDNMDASVGVSWDTISFAIEVVINERETTERNEDTIPDTNPSGAPYEVPDWVRSRYMRH